MKRNRFVKKITSWIRGGGILLLSNISLVSVGFASWTIGGATSVDAEIKINVDDVIEEQIITIDNVNYNFLIGQDGMVIDHTIVSVGSFVIKFTVDNKLAANYITDDGNATASINLFETSSTNFLTYVGNKPSCNIASSIGDNTSANSQSKTNLIIFPISELDRTIVSITYTVTDVFNGAVSEIGKSFFDNSPSLSISVKLEELV